jgi:hypothetical protein
MKLENFEKSMGLTNAVHIYMYIYMYSLTLYSGLVMEEFHEWGGDTNHSSTTYEKMRR